ncbi:MAG TPA: MoxR family ATPase [Candidatus Baltobacteraceae bacterium]|nr:MoxR family ATPase [Candidatus Baltobacteraceae bacterium]
MDARATSLGQRLRDGIARVVAGNERAAFAFLVALFGNGHILVEGVPGTGKTLFVRLLASLLGVPFRRIQFTPDLMPADVVGTTVFNPQSAEFTLRKGPIFTSLLLADEINRTPPKTQSALLEAMEERQVTIDGKSEPLDELFLVCATQNPVEFEGTYPLPEAQLDRFFVRARTTYPSEAQERALLARSAGGFDAHDLASAGVVQVAGAAELLAAQRDVRAIHVSEALQGYLYAIVARTRNANELSLGASPRAALALMTASQSAAALDGRAFATPDDVKNVAQFVLPHRLIVRPEAEIEGIDAETVVERILRSVEVPKDAARAAPA